MAPGNDSPEGSELGTDEIGAVGEGLVTVGVGGEVVVVGAGGGAGVGVVGPVVGAAIPVVVPPLAAGVDPTEPHRNLFGVTLPNLDCCSLEKLFSAFAACSFAIVEVPTMLTMTTIAIPTAQRLPIRMALVST